MLFRRASLLRGEGLAPLCVLERQPCRALALRFGIFALAFPPANRLTTAEAVRGVEGKWTLTALLALTAACAAAAGAVGFALPFAGDQVHVEIGLLLAIAAIWLAHTGSTSIGLAVYIASNSWIEHRYLNDNQTPERAFQRITHLVYLVIISLLGLHVVLAGVLVFAPRPTLRRATGWTAAFVSSLAALQLLAGTARC